MRRLWKRFHRVRFVSPDVLLATPNAKSRFVDSILRSGDWLIPSMQAILDMAASHGHDAVVLGALGCGAFGNPPRHIAEVGCTLENVRG
jgi:uncharacterized protein (TIGR02452 family)